MPTTVLLKRGVEEVLEAALSTTNSGSNVAVLPTEMMGARMAFQVDYTVSQATAPSVPILASLDGVTFKQWTNGPNLVATGTGEAQSVIAEGIKAIKVGTITLPSGGTAKVTVRAC